MHLHCQKIARVQY